MLSSREEADNYEELLRLLIASQRRRNEDFSNYGECFASLVPPKVGETQSDDATDDSSWMKELQQRWGLLSLQHSVERWVEFFIQVISTTRDDDDQMLAVQVAQRIIVLKPTVLRCHDPEDGQLPLHAAVSCRSPNLELIRLLLTTDPSTALVRETTSGLLPIELVANHIIAKEEAERYQKKLKKSATTTSHLHWECAHLLAVQHGTRYSSVSNSPPLLHACVAAGDDIPVALVEKALKRYKNQALLPDSEGNLPLHLVVADWPRTESIFFPKLLALAPQAAAVTNHAGCLPLHLALVRNRSWTTIRKLLLAHPPSVALRRYFDRTNEETYAWLVSELLSRACPETRYALLRETCNFL